MNYYLNPFVVQRQIVNRPLQTHGHLLDFFNAFQNTTNLTSGMRTPRYNIESVDDDNYVLRFEVPGFNDQNLKISVTDNVLRVSGQNNAKEVADSDESAEQKDAPKNRYLRQGYVHSSFDQQFSLNDGAVVTNAILRDGILNIEIEQKLPEKSAERVIKIKNS